MRAASSRAALPATFTLALARYLTVARLRGEPAVCSSDLMFNVNVGDGRHGEAARQAVNIGSSATAQLPSGNVLPGDG